jgi:tetratricopeptide (TPR) repeat protein
VTDLALDTLEARGLIRVAALQPELEYLFRHALVQDTAYGSLLKQERRALHAIVGRTLEDLYPERAGDLAAVLALHFEQAGSTDKAIDYLMAAARFASDRNGIVDAYELYGRAAALLPPRSDDDDEALLRRRVEIELGRARAGFSFISETQAMAVANVLPDARRLGDLRLEADVLMTIALLRQFRGDRTDDSPALRETLERVSEIGRELDDPFIAAAPDSMIGMFYVFNGRLREGTDILQRVAPLLERRNDFIGSSFTLVALAIGYARLGEFDKAEVAARRATELAEDGDLIAKLDALIGESTVRSVRGDLEGAIPLAMTCTGLAEETGATACVVASNFLLGDAYMRQGQFLDAKIAFERGNEVATAVEQHIFRPSIAASMRANAASLNEVDATTRDFAEPLSETRQIRDRWGEANVIWKRAETESKLPDSNREQMLADYEAAAAAFEAMGARPYQARVLRDWGVALRRIGRSDEGDSYLRSALKLFEELGISRDASELREVLGAG